MNFFKPNFWDKNKVSFFSILLFPFALLVSFLNFLRFNLIKTHASQIPIICIGNIYLGGTGKTPLSVEIFSILKSLNMKPAFIRKKYEQFQDEVNLQKQVGPVYQNKKRLDAVKEAVSNKINVGILDDGFQDFSINKNFSIICFNEKQWIGNGLIIPSGPLRESLSALKRAQCVVINGKKNKKIENKIFNENGKIKIFYTQYIAQNISEFENKKIVAFSGIGNPENFFDLLESYKLNIVEKIKFPDHHKFSEKNFTTLVDRAEKNNAILLTTEKDYFRMNENSKLKINYLKIKLEIENRNQFIDEIRTVI
tara:strand:- start:1767 stop:2696 length:930 start_codon:yes stop_codon:yes gene_type:complete